MTTLRAAVCVRAGEPLVIEELELDAPRSGEVLVRMAASGVCRSDLHQANGDWGERVPVVLGHEGAGYVEALGEGVTDLEVGVLVALNWFFPCDACAQCVAARPWMCTGTSALDDALPGGRRPLRRADGTEIFQMLAIGTFAERAVVPARAVVSMPEGVPPEVAALIGCGATTGVMSVLRAASVPAGASVAVIGLGGVGMSAIMGAVVAGASTIVAVDRVAEKIDRARSFGATHAVAAGEDAGAVRDSIAEATGGDGPDFVFDCIGFPSTAELAIESAGPGGTAVLVGIPAAGERASFDVGALIDRSAGIVGSNYGWSMPDEDFPYLAGLFLEGRLPLDRLIDQRIRLYEVNGALDALRRGEGLRRVIVF